MELGILLAQILGLFVLAVLAFRWIRIAQRYGLSMLLGQVFKASGGVSFHIESLQKRLEAWRKEEEYDKVAHYKKWAEDNFPEMKK